MVRSTKNSSVLVLAMLMAFASSGEALWAPATNLAQIKTWLINGNLNTFLNQSPLTFTILAAYYENVVGPPAGTNYDIWILVQVSKKVQKICHITVAFKPKNRPYIQVRRIICWKCKKPYHHHSSSSSHSHSDSHHSGSHHSHH